MAKLKRSGALLLAVFALAAGVAPAALADAEGGPGGNAGCAGNQPPPSPGGGCHHH